MKILCLCDQGNNRSVHFAHPLKYWKHDTISAGINTTSKETLDLLYAWADKIILTEAVQGTKLDFSDPSYNDKVVVFDVGPDTYPRPFNPELHAKVKAFLEENKSWLKPV